MSPRLQELFSVLVEEIRNEVRQELFQALGGMTVEGARVKPTTVKPVADVDAGMLEADVLAMIRSTPGQTSTELAGALNMTAPMIRGALAALREKKAVKVTGNGRGMRYSVK